MFDMITYPIIVLISLVLLVIVSKIKNNGDYSG